MKIIEILFRCVLLQISASIVEHVTANNKKKEVEQIFQSARREDRITNNIEVNYIFTVAVYFIGNDRDVN